MSIFHIYKHENWHYSATAVNLQRGHSQLQFKTVCIFHGLRQIQLLVFLFSSRKTMSWIWIIIGLNQLYCLEASFLPSLLFIIFLITLPLSFFFQRRMSFFFTTKTTIHHVRLHEMVVARKYTHRTVQDGRYSKTGIFSSLLETASECRGCFPVTHFYAHSKRTL